MSFVKKRLEMKCILFHHVNLKYSIVPALTILLRTKFDPSSSSCLQWLIVLPIKEYSCFLEHLKLSFAKLYFKEKVPSFMADTDKRGRRVFSHRDILFKLKNTSSQYFVYCYTFVLKHIWPFNVNKEVKLRLTKTSREWNKTLVKQNVWLRPMQGYWD